MSSSADDRLPQALKVGNHKFLINGEVKSVYGGAVHYWRLDRDKWSDILDKVIGMGFKVVETYIPWEAHEIKRGEFDFGQINPSNDIDAFLTLCEEKGLYTIVRPGPQINSELTWFGYPVRILDDPEMQALTSQGSKAVLTQVPRPIPAISYTSDKFFEETALWYDAICAILAKHAYPKGNLVACQVDNEMAFFFHINPYECDFSPSAIKGYRAFLAKKYETVEKLNSVYRSKFTSFDEVDAPRRFNGDKKEDIPFYTDWIEYRERYLVDSMDRLGKMLRERGLQDIPLFHNYPHPLGPGGSVSGITTPFNLLALEEKLDFVGFDIYSRKELYDHVKTVVSYVVGTSRYPFIPEFIAGVWPWYLNPGGSEDEEFVTKAALMHGIKGYSRYMIVERNRWLASPVRLDGRIREANYEVHRHVNRMANQHRFPEMERKVDVLLMANRDYDRLEAASVLVSFPGDFLEPLMGFSEYPNFMSVSEKPLGFAEPVQMEKSKWFMKFYNGLTDTGYQFLLGDTALPLERMQKYNTIMISSFEFMNSELQRKLVAFVKAGGRVVLGPRIPTLDEKMFADETILKELNAASVRSVTAKNGEIGKAYVVGGGEFIHLTDTSDPNAVLAAIFEAQSVIKANKSDSRLDVVVHRSADSDQSLVVFVANPTADAISAKVGLNMAVKAVKEIWAEQPVGVDGNSWSDEIPPYTIKIYECSL
ncbi:beta-galactosidase [Ornatilinea apprima]|uniref:Beta-galactosidase n=1 Tax=Ornatilinea apprima TaxID=1134406 RepID=A0A0P6XKM0_9CHLR|nr:beta-galactosidase [Ornatilinea apprima]KPL72093.1 beta-galactosidase [Ornatilinea apprima]